MLRLQELTTANGSIDYQKGSLAGVLTLKWLIRILQAGGREEESVVEMKRKKQSQGCRDGKEREREREREQYNIKNETERDR